jgi:Heterokaryon incompatibility protein Het-C
MKMGAGQRAQDMSSSAFQEVSISDDYIQTALAIQKAGKQIYVKPYGMQSVFVTILSSIDFVLRCLGQGLHCMEDFGAHTNYCELALRELGYRDVFPHCGSQTEVNIRGHYIFPLVTGTFGAVDFLHSVLGEANDHFTQVCRLKFYSVVVEWLKHCS